MKSLRLRINHCGISCLFLLFILTSHMSCQPNGGQDEVRKKVGQLFLLAFTGNDPEIVRPFIEEYGIGGLYLSHENLVSPKLATSLLNYLQQKSINGLSGQPLLTACDQEGAWGVMVPYSTTGPGNMALGSSSPANTEQMYSIFGEELDATGIFCDLAPVEDVNSNADNPIIGTRSFGEDADAVADHVVAAIKGLQQHRIISTAKHFPGHGNTATDSHSGIPMVDRDEQTINSIDLLPFRRSVEAGVDMVMTAHIIYKALDAELPATLSYKILTEYLRKKLGFKGVIITDSFNMHAIQKNYDPSEAAIMALLAGADMIMLAEERYGEDVGDYVKSQKKLLADVEQAVLEGRIPMSRINEAYDRIISLKEKYDLKSRIQKDVELASRIVGSKEHRDQAILCANRALCRLKGSEAIGPLKPQQRVDVVRLAREDVDHIMKIAEGIGPNYAHAFDDFVDELESKGVNVSVKDVGDRIQSNIVIAVGENYPLPGKSLDLANQRERLAELNAMTSSAIIYAGFKDPYDFNLVEKEVDVYVSAMGSNRSNVEAMVNHLMGEVEAMGIPSVSPVDLR